MKTALAAFAALFRGIAALIALVLALIAGPVLADAPVTKWQWGCEWVKAENSNYWSKVNGGCKHWIAIGYARHRDMLGHDVPAEEAEENRDRPSPLAPDHQGRGGPRPALSPPCAGRFMPRRRHWTALNR